MEFTHSYIHKANTTSTRALIGPMLLRFINKNASVFEALSRQGSPFGGNCSPANHSPGTPVSVGTTR